MASVFDVSKYFISLSIPGTDRAMTHLKLQKLVYYAHSWYVTLYDSLPLVEDDNIEAWIHGPVFPRLFREYKSRGYSEITFEEGLRGNIDNLDTEEQEIIDVIWDQYGAYSGKYLEEQTHQEGPWLNAREGHTPFDYGNTIITDEDIIDFFGRLLNPEL
ncbi:Panacea domain-containing protein [Terrihalobacillus insolitus]|uniref:Panacea domain-containing protein n=1 Tax=Terrihalobacillus insolitus TaxID=2950438 RepID=UPI0023405672|nr:type II toxin-antitoxin system antitoxin SocA domain-containing protein [Terrihalobacillus insolitus]MDC3414767.1 DUF4065 domain-containing protein [Terrihalobacillus insolitus]